MPLLRHRTRLLACLLLAATMTLHAATRPKIGLVLGGGGAKGAAEVGVLKVIERVGIPIDYIAGTSIGAIVGGLYAQGYRSATLDSMFRSQEWLSLLADRDAEHKDKVLTERDGVTYVFGFPVARKGGKQQADTSFGALRGDNIVQLLRQMTLVGDSISFDELPIPFRCVAADINTQQEVVFDHGSLPTAMRASMAIPGAFKPVIVGNQTLVDGGMLNNLPVDVVKDMGADIVIAIDLTQEKHATREFSLKQLTGIGGLVDWLVSRPDWRKYNDNCSMADIYINPPLGDYGVASFNSESIAKMIEIGEQEGERKEAELRRLLKVVEQNP